MFSRRWDPGITNGEWIEGILGQIKVRTDTGRRFSSHHRCMIMEFRVDISEEIWKIGYYLSFPPTEYLSGWRGDARDRQTRTLETCRAYGILLKLSIGKDSVVWVRLGMGTMTVDGSWTSLECMWVFFMLAWCYYGLLGESRKVSSWVGAGGVDTQALSMWRDKIEFSVGENTPMTVGMCGNERKKGLHRIVFMVIILPTDNKMLNSSSRFNNDANATGLVS
ncbi:hypothetical protein YC2023_109504 [Brassica napus]